MHNRFYCAYVVQYILLPVAFCAMLLTFSGWLVENLSVIFGHLTDHFRFDFRIF